jgi:predicted DNA-binding transcriptional regulator YafY
VTKRSVERDLVELSTVFGITCNDASKPYGWHWMAGCALELPGLDFTEALSLALVEDILGKMAPPALLSVLAPRFKQARGKLESVPDNRHAQWADRVRYVPPTLPFLPPKIVPDVLERVQEAILQQQELKVSYTGADDARARELTLHPLAFVQHGPVAYIVATAFGYSDPRLYALHRFGKTIATGKQFRSPAAFSLDAFLEQGGMQFGDGGIIRFEAAVSTKLACYLQESPLTVEQTLTAQDKDRWVLKATIKDSWRLQFWILSQGAEITVVKPKELRQRIRESLRATLDGYRSP